MQPVSNPAPPHDKEMGMATPAIRNRKNVIQHWQKHRFEPHESERCMRWVWFMGKVTTCDLARDEVVHQVRSSPQSIAKVFADDWFTKAPKYRTKEALAEHIQAAIQDAISASKVTTPTPEREDLK